MNHNFCEDNTSVSEYLADFDSVKLRPRVDTSQLFMKVILGENSLKRGKLMILKTVNYVLPE